jgi:hypothetical protein
VESGKIVALCGGEGAAFMPGSVSASHRSSSTSAPVPPPAKKNTSKMLEVHRGKLEVELQEVTKEIEELKKG